MVPAFAIGQDRQEELLEWQPLYKLNWADYKASPDFGSGAAATTTTYLGIEYNIDKSGFTYRISCRFSKNKSWGLHKTDYILSHEQGHFDIAEIFARKLHKEMSEYRFNSKTFQKDLQRIYENLMTEKENMQNEYDRETNHSINKVRQKEWLEKISQLLIEFEDYADYH